MDETLSLVFHSYASSVLQLLGFSPEVIDTATPAGIILFMLFSTEITVLCVAILIWVFIRRGSLAHYKRKGGVFENQGESGFPTHMVRRADTDDMIHNYSLTKFPKGKKAFNTTFKGRQVSPVKSRSFFKGTVLPIVLIFIILYASTLFYGSYLNEFKR